MSHKKIKYKPIDPQIQELARQHGGNREATLEVLRDLDARNNLNQETLVDTARALNVPLHHPYGVTTFYSMLSLKERKKVIRVCDGPVCWMNHAAETHKALEDLADATGEYTIERSSCLGMCDHAPAVLIGDEQAGPLLPADTLRLGNGWRGIPTDYSTPRPGEKRVMTRLIEVVDPLSIDSAIEHGVYNGLEAALKLTPAQTLETVEASGLQGRGGAGFPVGRKWRFVASEKREPRYVVCNADESEPLIFKDRVLMDTNPHQLLAGMIIAGYAMNASEGWIYIRGEYEHQARKLEQAVSQAREKGYLGENILGSGFDFELHIHRGAGAYICGEETALLESLEGKRGEPRLRPPYPPQSGFRGQPTAVNNVESFCAVPHILEHGAEWWHGLSDDPTPGTKIYMVLGEVNKPGLFEAPFGLTLRQVIEDFGGGMKPGSRFNFALCGGAAGSIVPPALLDSYLDYSSAPVKGVTRDIPATQDRWSQVISIGAGAFLIADQTISPVNLLRELMHFFAAESCGKCTPCRVGTWRSREILTLMTAGKGKSGMTDELIQLANVMRDSSFCGLGQSASVPILSALTHFEAEFANAENGKHS